MATIPPVSQHSDARRYSDTADMGFRVRIRNLISTPIYGLHVAKTDVSEKAND